MGLGTGSIPGRPLGRGIPREERRVDGEFRWEEGRGGGLCGEYLEVGKNPRLASRCRTCVLKPPLPLLGDSGDIIPPELVSISWRKKGSPSLVDVYPG